MSLAKIEAELANLAPEELRQLALKSWSAFVEKEGSAACPNDCSEDDPQLLAALDQAIAAADADPDTRHSADEVRARLGKWTSR